MKDGGRESTCMTRSWQFHGKKNTSPTPKNIFQKYPPENFQRPPRCRGGAVFVPPPYTFWRARQSR